MSPTDTHIHNWTKRNHTRSWKNFILRSNTTSLPSKGLIYRNTKGKIIQKPSFLHKKKTQKGSGLSEQLLRAMNMLSGRSQNTIQANITLLKNKNDKRNLANALRTTRKIRR